MIGYFIADLILLLAFCFGSGFGFYYAVHTPTFWCIFSFISSILFLIIQSISIERNRLRKENNIMMKHLLEWMKEQENINKEIASYIATKQEDSRMKIEEIVKEN